MKKFRDMTDSEKLEIINAMAAGERVEFCCGTIWCNEPAKSVWLDFIYRIPPRPMSIDWSVLKDEYICAAIDSDGDAFAYHEEPELCRSGWNTGRPYFKLNGLKSYEAGTVGWQDSLIWRPGFEPK